MAMARGSFYGSVTAIASLNIGEGAQFEGLRPCSTWTYAFNRVGDVTNGNINEQLLDSSNWSTPILDRSVPLLQFLEKDYLLCVSLEQR